MHHFFVDSEIASVYYFGVGIATLVLCCFLLKPLLGCRRRRVLAGIFTLVLPGCELVLYAAGYPADACRPIMAMMLICLTAWAIDFAPSWPSTRRLARPPIKWAFLLTASPVYVVWLTYGLNERTDDLMPRFCSVPELRELADVRLLTDHGREIKLYTVATSVDTKRLADNPFEADRRSHIIRNAPPSTTTNCHGWIFSGGTFWVLSTDVETILADNGYEKVDEPSLGDLVIYRNPFGQIVHSGLVKGVGVDDITDNNLAGNAPEDVQIQIESEWGCYGRFLHSSECQPYGATFDYYHSNRHGHRLQVVQLQTGVSKTAVTRIAGHRQDDSGVSHPGAIGY